MTICAFCRYSNDEKNNKCQNCKSKLISFKPLSEEEAEAFWYIELPLSKHEEAYWYRENLNTAYRIRLYPRETEQERLERERETFSEEWESIFGEIVGVLNRTQW